jgi:hypothetical protein
VLVSVGIVLIVDEVGYIYFLNDIYEGKAHGNVLPRKPGILSHQAAYSIKILDFKALTWMASWGMRSRRL